MANTSPSKRSHATDDKALPRLLSRSVHEVKDEKDVYPLRLSYWLKHEIKKGRMRATEGGVWLVRASPWINVNSKIFPHFLSKSFTRIETKNMPVINETLKDCKERTKDIFLISFSFVLFFSEHNTRP